MAAEFSLALLVAIKLPPHSYYLQFNCKHDRWSWPSIYFPLIFHMHDSTLWSDELYLCNQGRRPVWGCKHPACQDSLFRCWLPDPCVWHCHCQGQSGWEVCLSLAVPVTIASSSILRYNFLQSNPTTISFTSLHYAHSSYREKTAIYILAWLVTELYFVRWTE